MCFTGRIYSPARTSIDRRSCKTNSGEGERLCILAGTGSLSLVRFVEISIHFDHQVIQHIKYGLIEVTFSTLNFLNGSNDPEASTGNGDAEKSIDPRRIWYCPTQHP
jgi:hypothetical protein